MIALTHQGDAHFLPVAAALEERGCRILRLDTDVQEEAFVVRSAVDGQCASRISLPDGEVVDCAQVAAIWNRRNIRPWLMALGEDRDARQFVQEQFWFALMGALRTTVARWLNSPDANSHANLKLVQLARAAEFGLQIPRSLVTREHSDLVHFVDGLHGVPVIAKLISPGTPIVEPLSTQYMIFTEPVEPSEISVASLHAAPVLFQELIPKQVELRVTVVGDALFVCEIDSQGHPDARVDWRRVDAGDLPHAPATLPDAIATKVRRLVQYFGLRFAAIDLIQRPDGAFVFLELNPNGQWLWVEEQAGLPIAAAIADELLRKR